MSPKIKILALSDIHGRYSRFPVTAMPDADLVVIAGDITNIGLRDVRDFRASERWLAQVVDRYRVTLWIPGNHDMLMPPDIYEPIGTDGPNRLHCILDRRFEFVSEAGAVSLYGVTMCPCYDRPDLTAWAHSTAQREVEEAAYAVIPPDTNIVVSHCPPWLMLDRTGPQPHGRSIGSVPLRRHIEKHQPKAVISGHVHESPGHLLYGATDVYNVAETFRLIEVSTDKP